MDREELLRQAGEEHAAFASAIGELTLAWADVETVLYKLLQHYAGVSADVGRALFSGTRARQAITFIRAIADNTAMAASQRADLEEIFSQIASINETRDFVVHHVSGSEHEFEDSNPQERLVTDWLRASRKRKAKRLYLGSATLSAMRDDCLECC